MKKLLIACVMFAGAAVTALAYDTVPDGKYYYYNSQILYVKSSMGNLQVDTGTNTGSVLDGAHWYRRSGEDLIMEAVPSVGHVTGSYWSSGSYYTYYPTWTDSGSGLTWGGYYTYRWNNSLTFAVIWGNALYIRLQSYDGHYMHANNGGGSGVYFDRTTASAHEEFKIWTASGGTMAGGNEVVLGSRDYNKFLCAESGGGTYIVADRSSVGSWERFHIQKITSGDNYIRSGDQVSFTAADGEYWHAVNGGGSDVLADRSSVGAHETFTITFIEPGGR